MAMRDVLLGWEAAKMWLADTLHLSQPVLHAIIGTLLYLFFARVLRRPVGALLPLLPVLLIEAANEVSDFLRYLLEGWPWSPASMVGDVAATLLPPLALAILVRRHRARPTPVVATTDPH